ncbi:hypothetical protein [Lactobacillus sp. PV034]|uniref:hypothetical protein n=1 Tax=Lactobacillus sp. PV034 TaxID=2594495 RepID=UPI00223FC48F|nr:hypothetical protein [Lactobacillus sp. PV034]QNQ80787.1 hypothetical protein FP432_04075 [Lactobacillus sp. PV034]
MKDFVRYDDVLSKVNLLIGVDADNPKENSEYTRSVINFTLEKVIFDVSNYLNVPIEELPPVLDGTIVSLCVQIIDTHKWLKPIDERNNDVQSLNEGDTSVSFKPVSEIYASLRGINTISDDFVNILNNFRRVKF